MKYVCVHMYIIIMIIIIIIIIILAGVQDVDITHNTKGSCTVVY